MSDQPEKCRYMAAAYPTLDAEDTCADHRHEPRVFDLARAFAVVCQDPDPSDEQIGWFIDDADAVVDDFTPTPEAWTVEALPLDYADYPGIDFYCRVNGVVYVVQEGGRDGPSPPVAEATYRKWIGAVDE